MNTQPPPIHKDRPFFNLKDNRKLFKAQYVARLISFLILLISCSSPRILSSPHPMQPTHRGPNQNTQLSTPQIINDLAPRIEIFEIPVPPLNDPSHINTIHLGGFSSINISKITKDQISFRTLTDRGPNSEQIPFLEGVGEFVRIFLIPDFSPSFVNFELNTEKGHLTISKVQPFRYTDGQPLVGLPNRPQPPSKPENIELAADCFGHPIPISERGVDPESICEDDHGNLWVGEEYGPDIYIFDGRGSLLEKLTPGKGLPTHFGLRKPNRGFEAITCYKDRIYAMLQSPLPTDKNNAGRFFRIIEFESKTKKILGEYFVLQLEEKLDKVGDIAMGPDERLYVLVQNGKVGNRAKQLIYSLELRPEERNVIEDASDQAIQSSARFVSNRKIELDLSPFLSRFEKLEGLAITKDNFYLVNDNDFGVSGKVDTKTGVAEKDEKKKSFLIRISRDSQALLKK